jgi:hypothetical protein
METLNRGYTSRYLYHSLDCLFSPVDLISLLSYLVGIKMSSNDDQIVKSCLQSNDGSTSKHDIPTIDHLEVTKESNPLFNPEDMRMIFLNG